MNKNILIIVLLVLLVASIGAGYYFSRMQPLVLSKDASGELCEMLPILSTPIDEGGGLGSPYIARDICHFVFAYEKEDASICQNLKTAELRGQCYAFIAIKTNNQALCDSAPIEARDQCYSQVAQKVSDLKTCEKIQRADDRDNCMQNYASRMGDASICPKLQNINFRDSCYMNLAHRDPALCAKVTDVRSREDCNRNVRR